jgi:hypothetical protein
MQRFPDLIRAEGVEMVFTERDVFELSVVYCIVTRILLENLKDRQELVEALHEMVKAVTNDNFRKILLACLTTFRDPDERFCCLLGYLVNGDIFKKYCLVE